MSTRRTLWPLVLVVLAGAWLYSGVASGLVRDWIHDENYSHGFLIVPLAAYFVWERRVRLRSLRPRPTALGLVVVLASLAMLVAGVLGAEFFLARVSLIGVIAGTVLFLAGWEWLRAVAFPIAFLILMVPIPAIVFNEIAFPLQLFASRFGVSAMRLCGVPVLREGNVIVLANTTLEVAEACSGIRSLVSLLTLGLVYGYFADSRLWVRVVIAASTVPIAIAANGLRVAGTGVLAHYLGPDVAQGFFHTFSGWLVFLAAFGLVAALVHSVHRFIPEPAPHLARGGDGRMKIRALVVAVLLLATAAYLATAARAEPTPIRRSLSELPFSIEAWRGAAAPPLSSEVLEQLRVDDYTMRSYSRAGNGAVGLYVGYYATQRQGASIHSPLNCLPGAGWVPTQKSYLPLTVPTGNSDTRTVQLNRIVIEKGLDREVVLYWYQSHGRVVASEYWGKIYSVLDAIRINRTDAALVRVIAPVDPKAGVEEAERRATEFTRALFPLLGNFLPS